jgi:hypothetical protein
MATRLKTVQYAFPTLASLDNNTLTNLTQITVYLPESGTKTIQKAWVEVTMDDIITATGGSITTKTVNLRLAAIDYDSTTNSNELANSAENISLCIIRDFTSHFVTNWTGTSMTCDLQLQINQSTGTTLGQVNVGATLYITYEYDDTSTTHLKTVYIPLNAPSGSLPTTKTSHDTIPALDTYLPEASKVYRNIHIVTHVNATNSLTTDYTNTYELSSLGTQVTGNYESELISNRLFRYVWDITSYITTDVTHTFNVHSSLANVMDAMIAYMVVTYEFNASTSTSIMNSVLLPVLFENLAGTDATSFNKITTDFFVQEANVSLNRLAATIYFCRSNQNMTGLSARLGTGTFNAYTISGQSAVCGNTTMMVRNDTPTGLTFARGKNVLELNIYTTGANPRGNTWGCVWMVNYTSDKHADGVGVHNKTVRYPYYTQDTGANAQEKIYSADAIIIPETEYYINNFGMRFSTMNAFNNGVNVKAERLIGEGYNMFETLLRDGTKLTFEMGNYMYYFNDKNLFYRWTGDPDTFRINPETSRRYLGETVGTSSQHLLLESIITYHSIRSTVSGNITDSNGGTVEISLHKADTAEKILETSRVGNGAYSFTWYDNTEELYVEAYENNTYKGRSGNGLATLI